MRALRVNLMGAALQCRLNLAAAVTGNAANIANTAATGGHLPNQPVCIGTATPIVKVMVTNKLPAAGFAEVFLLVIAGFAVSLYILPTATGTANGILSFHTSNIPCLRCFLFARRLSAYILGHHPSALHRRAGGFSGALQTACTRQKNAYNAPPLQARSSVG